MKPLIDVILPIRPNPPRLQMVIRSLAAQDYPNWRLIALLDRDYGDNRVLIERELGTRSAIFVDCDYTTQGFPAMLNCGLSKSTAPYIARQDDDDVSAPSRFSSQLLLLQENPEVNVVTGFASVVDSAGNSLHRIEQPSDSEELCMKLLEENLIPHSSVMFRRTAVAEVGGYDVRIRGCEDYDLWLRILSWSSIRSVNRDVVELLQHDGGMSRTYLRFPVVKQVNSTRLEACRRLGLPMLMWAKGSLVWSFKELAPVWVRRLANVRSVFRKLLTKT